MKIQRIDIFHIAIPLLYTFETSFGIVDQRPAIVVKVTTGDGRIGFGESSPLYMPISESEVLADSMKTLSALMPKLIGANIDSIEDLLHIFDQTRGYPITKIGIEGAYFDLIAQEKNQPLFTVFGGHNRVLSIGESIGIKQNAIAIVQEIRTKIEEGYKSVKIKIKPGYDFSIVQYARKEFPDITLGVDANAAYAPRDISILKSLDQFNLAFIEQPFGSQDMESHVLLQKDITTPICLDESIVDFANCKRAIEMGACRIINIKPARIGSFHVAKKIHDYCVEQGIPLFGGGRMETGLGKTINTHFFALPGFTMPADMTPPLAYFPEDIIEPPLKVIRGEVRLPEIAGLGVMVNESVIEKYSQEHISFK